MSSKLDPSTYFSGSSAFKYQPTKQLDVGFGSTTYHSISAMEEYKNFSPEEIRLEDYKASGGFFGSPFAKLSGEFCVSSDKKLRPYCYGEQYKAAVSSFMNNRQPKPVNKINLLFCGKQRDTKVVMTSLGDSNVNVSFGNNLAVKDGQPSIELFRDVSDQQTDPLELKYEIKLKEKSKNEKKRKR